MASYQNAKKVSGGYEVQIPDYTKPTGMFGFQMTTQFIPDSAVGNVETRSRPMGYGMYDTTYDLSGVDIPEPETAPAPAPVPEPSVPATDVINQGRQQIQAAVKQATDPASSQLRQQIIDLYQAETGRMPSEDEINFYAGKPGQEGTGLYGETLDPAEIAQFRSSDEARSFLAGQSNIPGAGDLPPIKDPIEVEGSTLDPYLRPYLQTGLQRAEQLFLTGTQPSMFPDQMYVDPSQQRLAALQQAEDIATAPSPMLAEAQEAYRRALGQTALTAEGAFLGGSPYQQQMLEAATRPLTQQFTESVIPGISSQFSQAGRYGSGAMERALGTAAETYGRALGDVTTNIAYQDYLNERARQQQAIAQQAVLAQQAPGMYQQQFLPSTALQDVGMAREAIEALPLEEQIQRYQYQQQLPYQQLGGYLSSVYGTPMGSLAQFPDTPQASTLGQGLAGAALGSFLGGQFGRGGLGAVLGGIGGILGL